MLNKIKINPGRGIIGKTCHPIVPHKTLTCQATEDSFLCFFTKKGAQCPFKTRVYSAPSICAPRYRPFRFRTCSASEDARLPVYLFRETVLAGTLCHSRHSVTITIARGSSSWGYRSSVTNPTTSSPNSFVKTTFSPNKWRYSATIFLSFPLR